MLDPDEILSLLREQSGLRLSIMNDLFRSTVALFAVKQERNKQSFELAGTGTLVFTGRAYGILTAAHVWDEVLSSVERFAITLIPNRKHSHQIAVNLIVPTVLKPEAADWNELGPDIAFLRIPQQMVGTIEAYKVFESVEKRSEPPNAVLSPCWVAVGVPRELGRFVPGHADVKLYGIFTKRFRYSEGKYDRIDFQVNTTLPGVPQSFGGFSGGGLWALLFYWSAETEKVDWKYYLRGVAYWQSELMDDWREIRCNGPESIRSLLRKSENT